MNKPTKLMTIIACVIPLTTAATVPLPISVARAATRPVAATLYHLTAVTVIHRAYHVQKATSTYQIDFTADRSAAVVSGHAHQLAPNQTYVAVKSISLTTGARHAPVETYLQIQDQHGRLLGWVNVGGYQQPTIHHQAKAAIPRPRATTKANRPATALVPAMLGKVTTFFDSLGQQLFH